MIEKICKKNKAGKGNDHNGFIEEALEELEQLSIVFPDCDEVYFLKGNAFRKKKFPAGIK